MTHNSNASNVHGHDSHDSHDHSTHEHHGLPINPMKMRHAFIVVGNETLFLCHQVMSHMEGHNCEMVLEVELPEKVKKCLLEDRATNGSTHYLANITPMTLSSIKTGRQESTSWKADIWNSFPKHPKLEPPWGQTEPITPWIPEVAVSVRRVVVYRHYNENIAGRQFEDYHLFGKGKEAHLYHSITMRPEYDHIASLESAPEWLTAEQLEAGVVVSIPSLPWASDSTYCQNPLPEGSQTQVRFFGITEYRNPVGQNPRQVGELVMHVGKTWWYSSRVVNYFNEQHCPPENEIS